MGTRTRSLVVALFTGCTGPAPGTDKDDTSSTEPPADTATETTDPTDTETSTPPEDTGAADTGTPTDTGTAEPEVLAASCALTANALRVTCDVTLSAEGDATLTLTATGAAARTFVSAGAVEHRILGWGLLPDTTYDWAVGDQSGTVTTGSLPLALQAASITTTGTSWGFDAVLHPMECTGTDYFVMIDGEGRIVWFEPNDVYGGGMDGYEWSQASLTVMSINRDRFLEQHVSGDVALELIGNGVDFDDNLHHDVGRWGDLRYLLFEYPESGFDVDGIYVFEDDVLVGTFRLGDHFAVGGFGFGDWAHANGLNPTDDGELVLSLLNFDTVVGIDGDPASPTFLEVDWHAVGTTSGLPGPDYVPVTGPGEGFDGQHNASRHGDELWLFDNRSQADSRAIRLLMDDVNGTLTLDAEWSFSTTCLNHGGSIPLEGGGVLATCANSGEVWAFEEGLSTPSWTLEASCGGGTFLDLARAIPVLVE